MSFDNVRVICGVVLAFAAVVYAAESDFVCDVVKNSNVICEDCLHPCTGCGITCNKDGSIVSVFVILSFSLTSFFVLFCFVLFCSGVLHVNYVCVC